MSDIPCLGCDGAGRLTAFVDGRDENGRRWGGVQEVACPTCAGTGRISVEKADWIAKGRAHRTARVDRKESIFEAAKRLGITSAELSAMENGRADPKMLLERQP